MAITKVSMQEYLDFVKSYDASGEQAWYRFGQAFYNEFRFSEPDPSLFYQRDRKKAESIIFEKYIDLTGPENKNETTLEQPED